jgi:molybdate transport system permease protein
MLILSAYEAKVIWLTLKVAFISTAVAIPVSTGIAWVLARKSFAGKNIIEGLIALPLVAPPVVTGYLLLIVFGNNGFIGKWLVESFNIRLSFNFTALVMASVVVSTPLAVRTIKASFELIDPVYEKASMTLGASRFSTFFRISLPLALPGIISGMVLVFARSLGEFGATITFAGNIQGKTQTISQLVYTNMQIPGKEQEVMRLVVVSLVISVLSVILSEYYNNKRKYLIK